jgi:hypothetical protein
MPLAERLDQPDFARQVIGARRTVRRYQLPKEELRAELASVFLAAERGIPHDPEQHAAYVGSWIKTLKEDKNEIFRSAHDASRAADFLLALERDRSIASEGLRVGSELDSPQLGGFPSVVLARETTNRGRDRGDRELGPAQSAGTGRHGSRIIVGLALPKRDWHYFPAGQLPEALSEAVGEEGWYPGPDVPSASADLRDALPEAWQAAGHPGAAPALKAGDDWALCEGDTRAGARGGRQHGP